MTQADRQSRANELVIGLKRFGSDCIIEGSEEQEYQLMSLAGLDIGNVLRTAVALQEKHVSHEHLVSEVYTELTGDVDIYRHSVIKQVETGLALRRQAAMC